MTAACSDIGPSDTDAPRLHVETRGNGPPLLLLHGGVGSWNHWTRNIDAFAERFTVYAVDLPAFGKSPGVPRGVAGWIRGCMSDAPRGFGMRPLTSPGRRLPHR